MNVKVCCLILNYNRKGDTVEAARSLLRADLPTGSLIVIIDNGAKNLRTYFEREVKGCVYIKSPGNIGFAAGNNQGITYALKNKATHVLIMNPDVVVPKRLFQPLLSTFKSKVNAGLVAPAHQEPGSKTHGLGGTIDWQLCRFPHKNVLKLPTKPKQYDLLTFACVLIKSEVFKRVGPMDPRYFLYLEDVDYCVMAKKAGYELWLNPKVVVTHNTSSSFSDPRGKIKFSFKSTFIFINKWYRLPKNILPLLHTLYFYPYIYLLWTLKIRKRYLYQSQNQG
jgi:GT2 family glycosyltransferase